MWRLLSILALLPSLALAQFNDLNDPGFVAGLTAPTSGFLWSDPSGSNQLLAWWVASENTTNVAYNNANPWTNRMSTVVLRQSGVAPFATNESGLGMYLHGATYALTNAPLNGGTHGSNSVVCMIVRPDNDTINNGNIQILWSPYLFTDSEQLSTKGGFGMQGSSGSKRFSWGYTFRAGYDISGNIVASNTYDVILITSNAVLRFFTNGVLSHTSAELPPADGWPWRYLGQGSTPWSGWVQELLVWTNTTAWEGVTINRIHQRNTNVYPAINP